MLVPALNPLTGQRPMLGWDSSLGITGGAGVGGEVEGYAGMGAGYSFLLKRWNLPSAAMPVIRLAYALFKMGLNLATFNVGGMLRDGVGAVGGLVDDLTDGQIIRPIIDWVIPVPGGS
jgi:hypothetical protein